jgi:4'-phosphopantetheinyl transferase
MLLALPAFMQKEILAYRYPDDRKARLLARYIISDHLKKTESDARLEDWETTAGHKPYIPGAPCFNISHSGEMVVVAFDSNPVGIDIEALEYIDISSLIKELAIEEQEHIRAAGSCYRTFLRIWSRKEAYLKATGPGIVNGLSHINTLPATISDGDGAWHLKELKIDSHYTCHLCTTEHLSDLVVSEFTHPVIQTR